MHIQLWRQCYKISWCMKKWVVVPWSQCRILHGWWNDWQASQTVDSHCIPARNTSTLLLHSTILSHITSIYLIIHQLYTLCNHLRACSGSEENESKTALGFTPVTSLSLEWHPSYNPHEYSANDTLTCNYHPHYCDVVFSVILKFLIDLW